MKGARAEAKVKGPPKNLLICASLLLRGYKKEITLPYVRTYASGHCVPGGDKNELQAYITRVYARVRVHGAAAVSRVLYPLEIRSSIFDNLIQLARGINMIAWV